MYKLKPEIGKLETKLPLEKFIPMAFVIFLLFFIALSIITYQNITKYKELVGWLNHTQEVIKKTQGLNNYAISLPLARRSFIRTNDLKYLADFDENRKKTIIEIQSLKELVSDNPRQKEKVEKLDTTLAGLINVTQLSINLYKKELKETSEQQDYSDNITDFLVGIDALSEDIRNEENSLLHQRDQDVLDSSYNIQFIIIITSVFAFLVIGLSLFISNRLIKKKNMAEKLLHKSYDELEDKVEARTLELKNSNEQLSDEIENRVKVEMSLRESERRFRDLADSAPVMIWMSGVDKLCNYFNKGWLDFTGRTMEQESGNGWAEGVHPDDLQRCLDIYLLSFDKRRSFEMEYRLRNSAGEFMWILDKGVPRFEGEEFAGYIGCSIDINQRKLNERYLNIQYSVSKTLSDAKTFENASFGVLEDIGKAVGWDLGVLWSTDESTNKLSQSSLWIQNGIAPKEYSEIFDKSVTFQKGVGLPGIVWETGKPRWVQNIQNDDKFGRQFAALKAGFKSAFAVPVSNNGSVMLVIECFSRESLVQRDDLLSVLEAVGRQVGNFLEKKKAEEKLIQSHSELEERVKDRTSELANTLNRLLGEISEREKIQNKLKLFGHAIKDIKECVYITDLENRTLFVNSSFESTYGFYENELLGKDIPVIFSPEIPERLREEILLQTFRIGFRGELVNKRKDGSEFYAYLSTSVIRNDEGKVEAIVGICQDITNQKSSEKLIKKQNSLLNLLNDIILVTNKSFDLQNSISYALNKVCQYAGWDVGHAFLKNEDGILKSTGIWNFGLNEKYNDLKNLTEESTFIKGEGMPGRSYGEAKSFWIKIDEADKSNSKRRQHVLDAGLKTGIWVPIMKQVEVIGVLEFFKDNDWQPDNEILECISNIGVELGSLVERNDVLEKIKASERLFKAVAESANDAIITLNKDGKIIYVNKSAESIFGYESAELTGSHLSMILSGEYVKMFKNAFENISLNGGPHVIGKTIEASAIKSGGDEFPAEISLAQWEMNNEFYFTGMLRDISERKLIENELKEKQEMLLQAQQIAKLGSWEWDIKTDKVTWSDEMHAIYGVDRDTFEGTIDAYRARIYPDDIKVVKDTVENSIKNKTPFNYFHRIVTPLGEIKILNAQGEVFLDANGEVAGLYGTALDVTEIKAAEEKVRKNEKLLNDAQQIAKLGSWEADLQNNKNYWSEEMFRVYDLPVMEYGLSYDELRKFDHPDDLQRVDEFAKRILKDPEQSEINYRVITPEGRLKHLTVDIRVEFDDNSKPIRLFGSVQDVTDIKVAEEELKKANQALIETQKELVHNEKLAALGRFSSGIAHEIRNPLANISALSQLLLKLDLDEKSKKHLKYVLINADIANKIIRDLLNFASPEDPVFECENMNEILNNILESVEPRCTDSGIKIVKEIQPYLPGVYVDKIRIENALLNFVSNAIEAMPEGGELKISAKEDKLPRKIQIEISDTGMGIAQENLDKIFEPFFTTKKDGTGLGLGLAHQTIKSHSGSLDISSEENAGTSIKISIPIKETEQ